MNELFRDTSVLETLRPYFKKRGFIRGVSPGAPLLREPKSLFADSSPETSKRKNALELIFART